MGDSFRFNCDTKTIVIAGGGSAGWMTAAWLSKTLAEGQFQIKLVESDQIGTVGVGEATIPPILHFLRGLEIDEDEFVRFTQATFKLGIEFRDWTKPGYAYFHPFGETGFSFGGVPFPAYWLKMFRQGSAARLEHYSLTATAAALGKFSRLISVPKGGSQSISYAFHFDASLFARYLRHYAESRGVLRIEGKIASVPLDAETGAIKGLHLESGEFVGGDLFVDCSGFRAILIEGALAAGFEDWSRWLPCNSAIALPSEPLYPLPSHTLSTATEAGWIWRIPLRHRTGNGHVYCRDYLSDDEAYDTLVRGMNGELVSDPNIIRFTAGRRKTFWSRNCVAVGLSSGFLEPLESTSIHLVQRAAKILSDCLQLDLPSEAQALKFNDEIGFDFECIRDFLVLHYHRSSRAGEFWGYCRNMAIPSTLEERLRLFRKYGQVKASSTELFPAQSWLFVMVGMGIIPNADDVAAKIISGQVAEDVLGNIRKAVRARTAIMPGHNEYLAALLGQIPA